MREALQRLVQGIEDDRSLLAPDQLDRRLHALDVLDFHFPGAAGDRPCGAAEEAMLCLQARALLVKLEAVNEALYREIRTAIRRGNSAAALLRWLPPLLAEGTGGEPATGLGYDSLDALLHGIFAFEEPELPSAPASREMVFYQPTPARHIFRLLHLAALTADDVLVDLGSGLGHVPLLVAVCTPAHGVGIEIEASYVASARQCAAQLGLGRATCLHTDARSADLSAGTVFYLHTPFTGSMMRQVLDRLRSEAAGRSIRIGTYGPCTAVVAGETWLQAETATAEDRIAVFRSRS